MRLGVVDEGLGAVAALEQERLAAGDLRRAARWRRSTSGGSVTGGTLSSTVRTCATSARVGPLGLLGGGPGERVVQPGAQLGGQGGQLGQHFDRGVDGPVHGPTG